MKHSEETIKAAEKHALYKSPIICERQANESFLAGYDHRQKEVDDLVEAINYAVGLDAIGGKQLSPVAKKWFLELTQKHTKP